MFNISSSCFFFILALLIFILIRLLQICSSVFTFRLLIDCLIIIIFVSGFVYKHINRYIESLNIKACVYGPAISAFAKKSKLNKMFIIFLVIDL